MAVIFTIDLEERSQLQEQARTNKDARTVKRILVILALADGYRVAEVAKLFLLDEDTVAKWRNKYHKRHTATDWLAVVHKGGNDKLSTEQCHELEAYVQAELITDAAVLVNYIKALYGIAYTVNGVTKLLHRLGFVYKQTTLIPGKLDEQAQAAFKKQYEKLRDKLPKNEVILFGDGVHPSHNVHATKAWVKKGQDKQVPTNTGRKRLNINGVLDIKAMQVVVHYAETLNAQTTMELFDKIQEAYPDKRKIHLIVDNARYYKNKELQAYLRKRKCRIKIHWLPPYSPNLNFIERLWHFMKKYIIGTRRRQTFKEFEQDIQAFFEHLGDYADRLRRFIGTEMHLIKLNG
jgi:transposase